MAMMDVTIKEIDKVIELAKDREEKEKEYSNKYFPTGIIPLFENEKFLNTIEYTAYQQAEGDLASYLNSLDFEKVKEIQTLMYLGRDVKCLEDLTAMEEFEQMYRTLNWQSKNNEIRVIIEKLPLASYLLEGKKIMGL